MKVAKLAAVAGNAARAKAPRKNQRREYVPAARHQGQAGFSRSIAAIALSIERETLIVVTEYIDADLLVIGTKVSNRGFRCH